MNGGLTYKDLDTLKQKAKALDDIRDWLRGRLDSEKLITVSHMVEAAYQETNGSGEKHSGRAAR
jgi:hypothetical protein